MYSVPVNGQRKPLQTLGFCGLLFGTQPGFTCRAIQASIVHWLPAVPWVLQRDCANSSVKRVSAATHNCALAVHRLHSHPIAP